MLKSKSNILFHRHYSNPSLLHHFHQSIFLQQNQRAEYLLNYNPSEWKGYYHFEYLKIKLETLQYTHRHTQTHTQTHTDTHTYIHTVCKKNNRTLKKKS